MKAGARSCTGDALALRSVVVQVQRTALLGQEALWLRKSALRSLGVCQWDALCWRASCWRAVLCIDMGTAERAGTTSGYCYSALTFTWCRERGWAREGFQALGLFELMIGVSLPTSRR